MSDDFDQDDTESSITVVIEYTQDVSITRFMGSSLVPCRLSITADVMPFEGVEEVDFDVAFAKIKFWFETIISRCVICSRLNATGLSMILKEDGSPKLTNHLMFTPYEPTDEHLAVLFQSKMTALSAGMFQFGCVKVKSDSSGLVFTYIGDWEKDLPTMDTWFSKKPYYFETPWWTRDDVSTLDMIIGDDVDTLPPWAFKLDFIENSIRPNKSAVEKPPDEEVVIKFKPKVFDGGKEEDE